MTDDQQVEDGDRGRLKTTRQDQEHAGHAREVEKTRGDDRYLGNDENQAADDERGHDNMADSDQLEGVVADRGGVMGPLVDERVKF